MEAIDLTSPRVIAIDDRGRKYTITVAPIRRAQWQKYFDAIVNTSEYANNARVDSMDLSAARRELAESAIVDAAGYTSDQPLKEIEKWQTKLPASHLLTVGAVLTACSVSEAAGDEAIAIGREIVTLDATWGVDATGRMQRVSGLRHVFDTPTGEQQRRYSRDASRSRIVGGSRAGKTIWLGAQNTLMELYDELVVTVEGYAANGSPIAKRADIAEAMDGFHKVVAANALFTPAALNATEGEQ